MLCDSDVFCGSRVDVIYVYKCTNAHVYTYIHLNLHIYTHI